MIRLKNEQQIDGIRRCGHLLAQMFKDMEGQVKAGVTTGEIDRWAQGWLKKKGAKPVLIGFGDRSNPFPAALCISVNNEVIHGIPGKRVLREGDLVSVDTEIGYGGFIADKTVSFEIGKVSKEVADLNRVTRECLERGIAAAKAGQRIHQIARAVQGWAKENGYGVVEEYCGHGVGFEVHEDPSVPNVPRGANPRLMNGMVIAIEPMITGGRSGDIDELDDGWTVVTSDGKDACHWENTVAVFSDHTEILTELS
jgi:methionyl aminopeptidase